jgi:hypothetical protein
MSSLPPKGLGVLKTRRKLANFLPYAVQSLAVNITSTYTENGDQSKEREMILTCNTHGEEDNMCIQYVHFQPKTLKRQIENLPVDERIILKLILEKCGVNLWTELNWLRAAEPSGGFY